MSTTAEKVKEIVVNQLGVSPDQVTEEAKFIEDLGADSLDQVELIMAFEEEFGADIPDEDAEKLSTVGQAIKYVEERTEAEVPGGETAEAEVPGDETAEAEVPGDETSDAEVEGDA